MTALARRCAVVILVNHDDVSVVAVIVRFILGPCNRCLGLLAQYGALLI